MRRTKAENLRYELASWLFLVGSSLFGVSELMNLGADMKVIQTLLGVVASLLFTLGSGLFVLDARQR
ncbi:hypothetical protein L1047_15755 [Synechococcus sp. Nb3U1]|uniref:hypothetical protein n=1 Tax=Synechococcus sp. Nb3U1 TaxID=1914529 RepID=UPI001F286605|nr:hypothetical protein [Synechococcus sp. Nb3U1]MCF2972651.1 hypothetical protein [Synechococcus sp. Nb3U1]